MSISNHFQSLKLSVDQQTAISNLESFIKGSTSVFMLKGYAGSGKTTLIKGLIKYLESDNRSFSIMAPTGRAAKILRDKTGHGETIHRGIYNFVSLKSINKESEDDAEHSFHYYFPLNSLGNDGHIIIVDESSMISNVESKHELFTFGTNILLNDLLTFAKLKTSKNKIIFIGDPAQLPPVSDAKSLALDSDYFVSELKLDVEEVEMKEVMRQGDNLILANAKTLRSVLTQTKRNKLNFQFDSQSFIKTDTVDFIDKFVEAFPQPEIGNGVIISYSNAQCYNYNLAVREKIFPNQNSLVAGDLLLINNNNYHTYGVELFNGDIAKVIEVDEKVVTQVAPVYCDKGGEKVKQNIGVEFRKIKIRVPNHSQDIDCYIIDSLLHSINRDLSNNEMKGIYINFVIRFNKKQKERAASGLTTHKIGSEEFRLALKSDPFYNALKVKFGYAITCHKAQGGEWDKVFIDYSGRVSLKNHPLRWCYTATTRGKQTVYATNAPQFHQMSNLHFSEVGQIGTLPANSLSFNGVSTSPFHSIDQHICKSFKFWEIKEKLENTSYSIQNVESIGGYLERYSIMNESGAVIQLQASHKGSGHFIDSFKVIKEVDESCKTELEVLFKKNFKHQFSFDYHPKFDFLADLHCWLQQCCDDLGVSITNIQEGQYFVTYYLQTDSVCSYIQFYYNDNEQLTTAIVKTFQCENDEKLIALTQSLLSYAC